MQTKTSRQIHPAPRDVNSAQALAGLAIVLALLMPTATLAQSRTYYGADGRVTRRSTTDSSGSTTYYDATGRVTARTSIRSGTVTIYLADGRTVGSVTKPSKLARQSKRR